MLPAVMYGGGASDAMAGKLTARLEPGGDRHCEDVNVAKRVRRQRFALCTLNLQRFAPSAYHTKIALSYMYLRFPREHTRPHWHSRGAP